MDEALRWLGSELQCKEAGVIRDNAQHSSTRTVDSTKRCCGVGRYTAIKVIKSHTIVKMYSSHERSYELVLSGEHYTYPVYHTIHATRSQKRTTFSI